MDDFQYYNGLFRILQRLYLEDLLHNRKLTIRIIALAYCESLYVDCIRYSQLRSLLSRFLRETTKGQADISPDSFKKLVDACEREGFFTIEREPHKTSIYPNIPLIQKVINDVKMQSLPPRDKRQLRIMDWDRDTSLLRHKRLPAEIISVSDELHGVVTKAKSKEVRVI